MTNKIQRASVVSALILSFCALQSGAHAKAVAAPAEERAAPTKGATKSVTAKRPVAKPSVAEASAKPSNGKAVTAKVVPAKAIKATPPKAAPKLTSQTQANTPAVLMAASVAPSVPGCVPNLVDADFQTLPVNALEGLNRRLEALGLTRGEADHSVRTLTERAGGMIAGGSVIVARYVDSCDPRRVQVISVSLALDGPTSFTWLRGHDAPPVVVTDAVKPMAEPSPAVAPAVAAAPVPVVALTPVDPAPATQAEPPVVTPPTVAETLAPVPPSPVVTAPVVAEAPPLVAALPENPTSGEGDRAPSVATVTGFSVGSFTTKPEAPRRTYSDALPEQAPLGFHLRVAGQVTDGDLGPALSAAGLPLPVVQQVLDSFAADGKMPLASTEDLTFDVLYRASSDSAIDPVLTSAELSHGTQSRRLYYYVPEEGTAHLIDQQGRVRLAQGPDFIHPMPGYRMTSGFGWRQHPVLRARKFHKGVDWSAPRGTPVVAAAEGIVVTAKFHRGYGKYIRVVHDDRTETVYAHLDQFAKGMKVGQAVRQGQVIGTVGRTGIASGNHLYFELIVDGRHIDPLRNVPALVQDLLAEGKDKEDQQRFVSFADTLLQSVPATATASDAAPSYRTARTEPAPGDIP
ncbi:MAG: peptidoglycan DD-metalloendopeptidase family protein [Elstera sp.]